MRLRLGAMRTAAVPVRCGARGGRIIAVAVPVGAVVTVGAVIVAVVLVMSVPVIVGVTSSVVVVVVVLRAGCAAGGGSVIAYPIEATGVPAMSERDPFGRRGPGSRRAVEPGVAGRDRAGPIGSQEGCGGGL